MGKLRCLWNLQGREREGGVEREKERERNRERETEREKEREREMWSFGSFWVQRGLNPWVLF